jgi:hypothetical protein
VLVREKQGYGGLSIRSPSGRLLRRYGPHIGKSNGATPRMLLINAATGRTRTLLPPTANIASFAPGWSPDSTKILYVRELRSRVVDVNTGADLELPSPTGRRAFTFARFFPDSVSVLAIAQGHRRRRRRSWTRGRWTPTCRPTPDRWPSWNRPRRGS